MRCQLVDLDLAELADVADALAAQGGEVGGDARGALEVDDAGEGLVEEGADGLDGEGAGLGLDERMIGQQDGREVLGEESADRQSVDHGLVAHVHLAAADDLGHILEVRVRGRLGSLTGMGDHMHLGRSAPRWQP